MGELRHRPPVQAVQPASRQHVSKSPTAGCNIQTPGEWLGWGPSSGHLNLELTAFGTWPAPGHRPLTDFITYLRCAWGQPGQRGTAWGRALHGSWGGKALQSLPLAVPGWKEGRGGWSGLNRGCQARVLRCLPPSLTTQVQSLGAIWYRERTASLKVVFWPAVAPRHAHALPPPLSDQSSAKCRAPVQAPGLKLVLFQAVDCARHSYKTELGCLCPVFAEEVVEDTECVPLGLWNS